MAAAQASKIRQEQDLPKSVRLQIVESWIDPEMVEQKVLVLERKGLVLVGVNIARHMVDMFV